MSADIWFEKDGEQIAVNDCQEGVPSRSASEISSTTFNLTYNLSPMLRAAGMPPWVDFLGMKASDAGVIWRRTHIELVSDPGKYKELNPVNGWGDYEQAVEVIGALADACERFPGATVGGWL